MSQRDSGFKRIELDAYETPEWATLALVPHLPTRINTIWEPAAGSGKMANALKSKGYIVVSSDIKTGNDFLMNSGPVLNDAIITNPPYEIATKFIERALNLNFANKGLTAMLLRCDFDSAKTRKHLFADNKTFSKKLVLTKRIQWIEGSTGSPSFNHCWMIWDWQHSGPPTLAYGP